MAKVKARNPLRMDPTRTASLRRAFERQVRVRFERLRQKLKALLLDEDALGLLAEEVPHPFASHPTLSVVGRNAFCPTGPGGGQDNSCSPGKGGVSSSESKRDISIGDRDKAKLIKGSKKIAGKKAMQQLEKHGIAISRVDRSDTSQGRASYLKYQGVVVVGENASGHDVVHEIGHALDATLASDIRVKDRTFDEQKYWSEKNLSQEIALDRKSSTPKGKGPSWGNKVASWEYAFSEPAEAFSHIYASLAGDDTRINGFSIEDAMPKTYAKVRQLLKQRRLLPSPRASIANSQVVNAHRWQFASDPEKIKQFKAWLKTQIIADITGKSERELWEAYTKEGLQKGAGRAFDDTRRPQRVRDQMAGRMDFYQGSRDEFLRSSFHQPVAIEKVQLLAARSFDELEDISTTMATRMTRHLTDGLVRGASPREIARDLDRDIEIGRGRALTIARTEIIRAHAEGQLMALEQLGVEEVGVAVEWSTAGDDKVCELCQPLEGVVLKLDEAKGMLPRHPNCRCAWVPANVGEDDAGQKDTKFSISQALGISVDREGGFDRSRWLGADLTPAASRPQSQVGNEDYLSEFSKAMTLLKGQ